MNNSQRRQLARIRAFEANGAYRGGQPDISRERCDAIVDAALAAVDMDAIVDALRDARDHGLVHWDPVSANEQAEKFELIERITGLIGPEPTTS